jgi:hypothetical protein
MTTIAKLFAILDEHEGQLTLDDMKRLMKELHDKVMRTQHVNQYANKWEVDRGMKYLRKREKGVLSGKKKALFELYDQGVPSREAWKLVNCWPNYARIVLEEWEAHYDLSFVEGRKRA